MKCGKKTILVKILLFGEFAHVSATVLRNVSLVYCSTFHLFVIVIIIWPFWPSVLFLFKNCTNISENNIFSSLNLI